MRLRGLRKTLVLDVPKAAILDFACVFLAWGKIGSEICPKGRVVCVWCLMRVVLMMMF